MKKAIAIAALLLATSMGGAAYAAQAELSFEFRRLSGFATNQFAVWVEDASGKLVRTIYATNFTASGGWEKRPNALLNWVKASDLPNMEKSSVDAITGPTPQTGPRTYTWDFTDDNGKPVPDGDYTLILEGTLRDANNVLFRAPLKTPGVQTPEPHFVGDDDSVRSMITDVKVEYKK